MVHLCMSALCTTVTGSYLEKGELQFSMVAGPLTGSRWDANVFPCCPLKCEQIVQVPWVKSGGLADKSVFD
jgi:hypothetical protein